LNQGYRLTLILDVLRYELLNFLMIISLIMNYTCWLMLTFIISVA